MAAGDGAGGVSRRWLSSSSGESSRRTLPLLLSFHIIRGWHSERGRGRKGEEEKWSGVSRPCLIS